mmetsp:Transcript_3175/g.9198  ORF Transcript_3175/g.9198 Transcript_3175/m.9198 type:complete len:306 (-) Transcript_3175:71-988(-)
MASSSSRSCEVLNLRQSSWDFSMVDIFLGLSILARSAPSPPGAPAPAPGAAPAGALGAAAAPATPRLSALTAARACAALRPPPRFAASAPPPPPPPATRSASSSLEPILTSRSTSIFSPAKSLVSVMVMKPARLLGFTLGLPYLKGTGSSPPVLGSCSGRLAVAAPRSEGLALATLPMPKPQPKPPPAALGPVAGFFVAEGAFICAQISSTAGRLAAAPNSGAGGAPFLGAGALLSSAHSESILPLSSGLSSSPSSSSTSSSASSALSPSSTMPPCRRPAGFFLVLALPLPRFPPSSSLSPPSGT